MKEYELNEKEITDEKHGPLIRFSFNRTTHSMMAGGGSSCGDSIEWGRDGSITLKCDSSGGGKSTHMEYRLKPDVAEKVRDFVTRAHLAAVAKMDIQTPLVYDCFTSASITMGFDDSEIGGSRYESVTLQCGPAGMTFKKVEDEIYQLISECKETGECTVNEERENGNGFLGMMNPGMMGMNPLANLGNTTVKPGKTPTGNGWKCMNCGYEGNEGKFCTECGCKRPLPE